MLKAKNYLLPRTIQGVFTGRDVNIYREVFKANGSKQLAWKGVRTGNWVGGGLVLVFKGRSKKQRFIIRQSELQLVVKAGLTVKTSGAEALVAPGTRRNQS